MTALRGRGVSLILLARNEMAVTDSRMEMDERECLAYIRCNIDREEWRTERETLGSCSVVERWENKERRVEP